MLVELEASLGKRERDLEDAAKALERDRVGQQLEVQQLDRDREDLERAQAVCDDRAALLDEDEAALADLLKKLEAVTRVNEHWAGQLTRQEEQQASREAKLGKREEKVKAREGKVQAAVVRHRQRSTELSAANAKVIELEEQVALLTMTRDQLQKKTDRLQKKINGSRGTVPAALQISTWDIAQWMLRSLEIDFENFADKVAFSGDGPFSRSDLEGSARALGLRVGHCGARQAAKLLVVGRTDWDQRAIQAHIDALADEELFVFPQELWVAALLIGYNPFRFLEDAACRSSVEAFGHGHPVIDWLRDEQFPWPEWEVGQGDPGAAFDQRVKASPLVKLDYRVGRINGLPSAARRRILSEALSATALPAADFEEGVRLTIQSEYMASWGDPSSRTRLRRMAWHLAMLITMHDRLRNHEVAVQEWQDDLAWLGKKYYSPLMRFQWP